MANLPFQVRIHVQGMTLQDRMLSLLRRCFTHYAGRSWSGSGDTSAPAVNPPEARSGCTTALPAPCTGAVFSVNSSTSDSPDLYDIQYTPRFAYIPEMAESSFPSGTGTIHFKDFRATFIQRLVLGTGNNARPLRSGHLRQRRHRQRQRDP